MYGGEIEDYLPDVEIHSAIVDVYRVFTDVGTQWRTDAGGRATGLDYSAVKFVLECHELRPDQQMLRDIRVLEAAALSEMNKKE